MTALTALGIVLISVGAGLVCFGIIVRPRARRSDVIELQGQPGEFRTIVEALHQEERRSSDEDPDQFS